MKTLKFNDSHLVEIELYILSINVITFEVQRRIISQLKREMTVYSYGDFQGTASWQIRNSEGEIFIILHFLKIPLSH